MKGKMWRGKILVGLMALLGVGLMGPAGMRADNEETETLTIESAIGIGGDLLEASVAYVQGKVTFIKENGTDPEAMEQRFNDLGEAWAAQQQAVYEKYKTSSADYLAFTAKNRTAMDDFLSTHEKERARLEDLKSRMDALISDLEALMEGSSKRRR